MKPGLAISALWLAAAAVTITLTPRVAAQGRKAARPQIVRPDGPEWLVIRKNCISCHGIDDYAFYAQDKAGWQKVIATKHPAGVATLSEKDRNALLDWLVSRFGPNTKPFPRTYIPPEITTFFSDPEANRLVDRACTACHARDRVDRGRYAEDGWRVVAVDMRERGAKLDDEELEQLVEWLGRTHGTNAAK